METDVDKICEIMEKKYQEHCIDIEQPLGELELDDKEYVVFSKEEFQMLPIIMEETIQEYFKQLSEKKKDEN